MRINAALVRELREERSWLQDDLAIAAGLDLRTIQPIERQAVASLQSLKALAAVFDVDASDLGGEGAAARTRYEYKTIEIDPATGFLTGLKRQPLPNFAGVLNREGEDGWQLVQILTPELAQGVWAAKSGRFVALLQRSKFD